MFCCDQNGTNQNGGMPKVCLQVSAPVALGCRIVDCSTSCNTGCGCCNPCNPCNPCGCNPSSCGPCDCQTDCAPSCGCSSTPCSPQRQVLITIGIFIIVQMERRVQMLMPAYDFCIPTKEPETPTTGDPCELFKKIKFPTDSFFPPNASEIGKENPCGCDR